MSDPNESLSQRIVLGSTKAPRVLRDLAETLPNFGGRDLESQLQSFDAYLAMLSEKARPEVAALLNRAAVRSDNPATRERLDQAAESVRSGGRAAESYDHAEAMRQYAAEHAADFELKPPETTSSVAARAGRQVEYSEYMAVIRNTNATLEFEKPGSIGEIERWVAGGRVVAWLIVRYFKGENDYDYYVDV